MGQALELANWGLREGRSVVPRNLVNLLINAKFVNPMLGIVGAHCLLMGPDKDADLTNTVLTNLGRLVPGHPDLVALRWIAAREGIVAGPMARAIEPGAGITWPPMLLPSYRALIEMDVLLQDAIADDSVAERAAAQLTCRESGRVGLRSRHPLRCPWARHLMPRPMFWEPSPRTQLS